MLPPAGRPKKQNHCPCSCSPCDPCRHCRTFRTKVRPFPRQAVKGTRSAARVYRCCGDMYPLTAPCGWPCILYMLWLGLERPLRKGKKVFRIQGCFYLSLKSGRCIFALRRGKRPFLLTWCHLGGKKAVRAVCRQRSMAPRPPTRCQSGTVPPCSRAVAFPPLANSEFEGGRPRDGRLFGGLLGVPDRVRRRAMTRAVVFVFMPCCRRRPFFR